MTTLTRSYPPAKRLSNPVKVWLALVACLGVIKLLLTFFPGAFVDPNQAAIFSWTPLTIISLVGLGGVWLA